MINKKDLKIVFFGTPEFAVKSLETLVNNDFNVVAVVTMPDKPAGRGRKMIASEVKTFALNHDLPVLQPEKLRNEDFVNELRGFNADLFIVIAFRMLPEVIWNMPRLGTFNLHASLLPKYRGAAPINRVIMNGETETGVTTFFLKHEIDTGDIIDARKVEIGPNENAGELHDKLMNLGAEMVLKTCNDILADDCHPVPQPNGDFTAAPKIFKEDCKINWNLPASDIHNHIRGLAPYPAAWSLLEDAKGEVLNLKIIASEIVDENCEVEPGLAKFDRHNLYVATADYWLKITSLQPAGKKPMDATAFLNGYKPYKFID